MYTEHIANEENESQKISLNSSANNIVITRDIIQIINNGMRFILYMY